MTPLISALINLAISGVRKGRGGGGGGSGGSGGGRPKMSQEEQSDRYWTKNLLSSDAAEDFAKQSQGYLKALGEVGGAGASYQDVLDYSKKNQFKNLFN